MKNGYEVIIIGGEHHNGLGLARILGLNGIRVHAYVIGDIKKSFLRLSKYVEDCRVFPSEACALDDIKRRFDTLQNRYFIIPYSDTAALSLDLRLDEFSDFFVPSINKEKGRIAKMMDKVEQYNFAKEHNIKMAETLVYYFNKDQNDIGKMKYPCIVKPVISAEGHKRDITICYSKEELENTLRVLKQKKYSRVLIQEFLKIDYEIDVFGCILKSSPFICQIPTKTIRSWPISGGTNSYSQIITDEIILHKCKKIISAIKDQGFYGLFDVELFVIGEDIVLNEINYRNSGDVYMGINQRYYYPYAWTQDCMGQEYSILPNPNRTDFTITECADIRNVMIHEITFFKWIKECFKCRDYALFMKNDLKPAFSRYLYYFLQLIKGKRL